MAIAPNACQSKENSIKTSQGIMTVDQILKKHCAAYATIEEKAVKQWVNLDSQLTVPTLLGDKNVNEVWYNGVEEVIEIEFEDGNKYKFTENHLLLVRTNDDTTKWVRVGDLTGDEDIVNI
jgi:intein/homing endonuclease